MKSVILIATLLLVSCKDAVTVFDNVHNNMITTEYNKCEYVYTYSGETIALAHKGNCKYCEAKKKPKIRVDTLKLYLDTTKPVLMVTSGDILWYEDKNIWGNTRTHTYTILGLKHGWVKYKYQGEYNSKEYVSKVDYFDLLFKSHSVKFSKRGFFNDSIIQKQGKDDK